MTHDPYKKFMKILQILPELNVGGVETGTVDFAKYLVTHGHQSIVVSNGGKLVPILEETGTKHYTLPVDRKSLWTIFEMIKALRKIIQDEKVDIVHARSRVPAWIAYFACRRTNAAFITTCHGFYKNKWFSQVMSWSKLTIVPSLAIGHHMIEDYDVLPENIRCIARSVDLERFKVQHPIITEPKSFYTVAILGRITPLKGHSYFLKAMAKVIRTNPFVKVLIIGDAPAKKYYYRQELETLAHRLGIKSQVEFLGNRSDIPDLLVHVDLLVFSSIEPESFGRAIVEAQAAGVPVIATKVGGVVDIIEDGKNGILVMPKDIEAMATQTLRILGDPKLASRLVEQAQKTLREKFTIHHMASKTIEVYEELLKSINILVIKISSLGDVILVTPSLRALGKKFPNAKIHCLVGKESRKILVNCPYVDELIVYDHKGKDRGWFRLLKLAHNLRRYNFDKVIDFQNNQKSHALCFLSFSKESYGFDNGKWSRLLSQPVKNYDPNIPAVVQQFQILSQMGIAADDKNYLELWPSERNNIYVKNLLESEWINPNNKIVGINIAASEKWKTKNWSTEHIVKLCDMLAMKHIRVIITGIEKDKPLAQHILSLTRSKPANFVGKTDILQLAALIKRCKVFITPDSAPLHVAAAMQTPVIAFFGPTDSKRHAPPAKRIVVLEKKLSCTPCYSPRCKILTHACMKEITPEEVFKTIETLIKEPR